MKAMLVKNYASSVALWTRLQGLPRRANLQAVVRSMRRDGDVWERTFNVVHSRGTVNSVDERPERVLPVGADGLEQIILVVINFF